jgi:hypothetical protein
MLNKSDFEQIVSQVAIGHLEVLLRYDDRPYIQIRCNSGVDTKTGQPTSWTSRKWMLSPHMVKSEVVRTIYKAYHAAVLHEADEVFTYKGVPIYSPHYDVDSLADAFNEDARVNGMTGI